MISLLKKKPSKGSYENLSDDRERCSSSSWCCTGTSSTTSTRSTRRPRWCTASCCWYMMAGLGLGLAGLTMVVSYNRTVGHLPQEKNSRVVSTTPAGTNTTTSTAVVRVGETIPTLLSLRDENGRLLSAKANPLYEWMKNITIVVHEVHHSTRTGTTTSRGGPNNQKNDAAVATGTSKNRTSNTPATVVPSDYYFVVDAGASPTSTGEPRKNHDSTMASLSPRNDVACWDMSFLAGLAGSRLVALQCGVMTDLLLPASSSPSSPWPSRKVRNKKRLNHRNIYEVATVAQLQMTAQQSTQCNITTTTTSSSPWSIPIPFSIRVPYCQWLVLQEDDVAATAETTNQRRHYEDEDNNLVFLVVGVSNIFNTSTSPLNIHLAYRADPTELVVQFSSVVDGIPVVEVTNKHTTDDDDNTENESATASHSSSRIGSNTMRLTGTTTSYGADDLCQAPANETGPGQFQSPGYLHTVILTDLPVDTDITYRVGLETSSGMNWRDGQMTTRTNLPAGTTGKDGTPPYTYLVYGDQGCPVAGWEMAADWIDGLVQREAINNVRAIHHFGDLSYAEGVAHQWDAWLTMLEPASVRWPLMISVGNHEYDYLLESSINDPSGARASYHPVWGNFALDSGGECAVPVVKRFQMPDTGNSVFWYSYDSGLVHTIVLSSEHDLGATSDQHEWFRRDLRLVDRTLTPWLIVELHRPLYEDEAYWEQNSVGIGMRDQIEDLLIDYRVDLVLSGHYHAYHRTSTCNNGGPLHLTIGTAGARLDETDSPTMEDAIWTNKLILGQFGYGRVTVHNATALQLEFVKHGAPGDPNGGSILDTFWLERQRR